MEQGRVVEIACLIVIQLRLAFAVDKIFAVHSPSQTLFGPKEHTSCVCVLGFSIRNNTFKEIN
jgi:hypothetical protein